MAQNKKDISVTSEIFRNAGGALLNDGSVISVGADFGLEIYDSLRKKKAEQMEEDFNNLPEYPSKRIPGIGQKGTESPVENSDPIPLLPNLDSNARHTVAYIRITKKFPPGDDGIKGNVPNSADIEFVARRWGDGIYDFEGMNQNHQCLRRQQNVKIAMGLEPKVSSNPIQSAPIFSDSGMSERLLIRQSEEHDKNAQRNKESADKAIDTARQLSQDYATMIREDSKTRSERDRDYHKSNSEQQTNFFQSMLESQRESHNQAMERERESFRQTMQLMHASHEHTMAMNNPAFLLTLFKEGLMLGSQQSGGEETDPLTTIVNAGVSGLSEMRQMMQLSAKPGPAKLPSNANPSGQKSDKKLAISREEMMELIRLKKSAEKKGYDFSGLVKQAQVMVENAEPEATEDESEESEESDSEGTGESNLE